jgi:hypothetical protein
MLHDDVCFHELQTLVLKAIMECVRRGQQFLHSPTPASLNMKKSIHKVRDYSSAITKEFFFLFSILVIYIEAIFER